jgi:TfoX/Sxy family transcriptional regulator of competence genes
MMKPKKARTTTAKKTPAKKRQMPEFSKPSQDTLDAFNGAIGRVKGVERKTMFGYPAVFVNGNMLACVFQDRIMIRLSEHDRADALAIDGAKPFEPSPGRAMREYVDFPRSVVGDTSLFAEWMRRGADYAGSLPRKQKKR